MKISVILISSLEVNNFKTSQEVRYSVHKIPLRFRMLSQLNPMYDLTVYFIKIHFNIIPPFYVYVILVAYLLHVFSPELYMNVFPIIYLMILEIKG
jgi:hypothetical protein